MDNKKELVIERIREVIKDVCPHALDQLADLDQDFFDAGIDSLDFSSILLEIEEGYEIKILDGDIANLNTLNSLAAYVTTNSN